MSGRQVQKMLRLMASGEPVTLTSPMASVKKLARLAFIAQQFGYEYADVHQGTGRNTELTMLIVPDPGPHARTRAAQNWAQYPNAGDGVSLPPLVPDALELLKARINFDLTGKSAEKRMGLGAVGSTVGVLVVALQTGFPPWTFILWVALLALMGFGVLITRHRNAKYAARLRAAGFVPVADGTGRTRYLPPGGRLPGHGNPFGGQSGTPHGGPAPTGPYGTQPPAGPYGAQPPAGPAGPYGAQPSGGPYGAPPASGPYGAQPPQPYPGPAMPQQPQPPPYPQPQYPQQNPHWQPPQQ